MTNFEYILSMNSEKLADFLLSNPYRFCSYCMTDFNKCDRYKYGITPEEECKNAFIQWLNNPVKKE